MASRSSSEYFPEESDDSMFKETRSKKLHDTSHKETSAKSTKTKSKQAQVKSSKEPSEKPKQIEYHTSTQTEKVGGATQDIHKPLTDDSESSSDSFSESGSESGKKEKQKEGGAKERFKGFEARTTPKPLTDVVKRLTEEQKEVVVSMGLGGMLHLDINKVYGQLGGWLVKNYDVKESVIRTPAGDIKIAPRHVKYIFGLQMGGRKIVIPKRPNHTSTPVRLFRSQYNGPRPSYVR